MAALGEKLFHLGINRFGLIAEAEKTSVQPSSLP